jgi:hypothetical protein
MENNLKPIRTDNLIGEYQPNNSLIAYKAENAIIRAAKADLKQIENHMAVYHNILRVETETIQETGEKIEYTLLDRINNKLVGSNITTTLNTYEIYQEAGIVKAIEYLLKTDKIK